MIEFSQHASMSHHLLMWVVGSQQNHLIIALD
jgi:hypothetical protein